MGESDPLLLKNTGKSRHVKLQALRKIFITALAVTITLLWWLRQINGCNKISYPPLPKIPAHVPYLKGATFNPDENLTIVAKHGAVASDMEKCSQMGVEILKKGGFAADAAVTTCLCIGTVDTMYSSGIGGGAFITTKLANETGALSIDAREMAPGAAYRDMFKGREIASKYGGLAVAIPGELRGLYTLYKSHGSGNLSWSELVSPVAELARSGWNATQLLPGALSSQTEALKLYRKDWNFVYNKDGSLKKAGDFVSRPELADTFDMIAKKRLGCDFLRSQRAHSTILGGKNFARYKVVVEPALQFHGFSDRNLTIYSPAGSSSGVALLAAIEVFNGLKNDCDQTDFTPVATQRLVESMKWLASVRTHLGDIGTIPIDTSNFLSRNGPSTPEKKIHDDRTLDSWKEYQPAYQPNESHGTSSLSVVDQWGNAVSITTTVNLLFGSMVHDPVTGVIMNDEMDDFSVPTTKNAFELRPSIFNYIEPYKRPLSSCSQSLVVDPKTGKIDMLIGAAGGSRIPTAIFQTLVRTYFYGMDILEALAFPRLHHQLIPEILYIESPSNSTLENAMLNRGHKVEIVGHLTAMNAIRLKNNTIYAQSDYWRKLGRAAGY
ncbi:hypothetical protein HII12_002780 [Brettanomyces bruxellensis]|uniref:Glutathione hydrolase n=1 Tax=Dekkera bruxellensis TaxID=5007 RepID=A0A8H6EU98_DEKBR|nr:hypothetical protein HII12_002780 [Brettanomyces bruxellensis]